MSTQISVFACPSDPGNRIESAGSAYGPGGSLKGALSNYDFITSTSDSGLVASPGNGCNYWKRASTSARYMFGENSNTRLTDVTDGTSNTFMVGEGTVQTQNGQSNPWGYRGWVMTGIDPNGGLNRWYTPAGGATQYGKLASWGYAGSLHTNGCYFAMGDASVRFVNQSVSSTNLLYTARMSDNQTPSLD